MRASAPARAEVEGRMDKRQRDSDNGGMRQQTDGKVNIPLVEIFRLHARLDFIAPIGILHCESVCVSVCMYSSDFSTRPTAPRRLCK